MLVLLSTFILLLVLSVQCRVIIRPSCDEFGTLLYDELGCTPIKRGFEQCATSYNCSNYRLPKQGCLFEKHVYKDGETINGTNPCNNCICIGDAKNGSKIECRTPFYLPPWFQGGPGPVIFPSSSPSPVKIPRIYGLGPVIFLPNVCYFSFDLNKCFPKRMCPPYKNISVCVVDHKGYIEGEKFQPIGKCLDCVCQKGYQGKYVEPFCRKKRCDVEIRYAHKIIDNCAPLYNRNQPYCCPYDFICSSNVTIEHLVKNNSTNNVEKCKFGSQTYNQYDSLDLVNQYNVTFNCRCAIPPLLTCTR